jgi:hypothetical protein
LATFQSVPLLYNTVSLLNEVLWPIFLLSGEYMQGDTLLEISTVVQNVSEFTVIYHLCLNMLDVYFFVYRYPTIKGICQPKFAISETKKKYCY